MEVRVGRDGDEAICKTGLKRLGTHFVSISSLDV